MYFPFPNTSKSNLFPVGTYELQTRYSFQFLFTWFAFFLWLRGCLSGSWSGWYICWIF